jgi:hypothetical protein
MDMRTTLDVDPAILKAAKAISSRTKQSIGEIISTWARRGLNAGKEQARRREFPVFDVPADAEPIYPSKVAELLADEGLSQIRS